MIKDITSNLVERGGIYFSTRKSAISYPDDQNQNCMQFEADSFWFMHRNHCMQAMMRNYLRGGIVADIGGGNGFVCPVQAELFESLSKQHTPWTPWQE